MRQNPQFTKPNRRSFLVSSAGAVGALFAGAPWMPTLAATPILSVTSRTLEVNKKAATVFSVLGSNGKTGMIAREGDRFLGGLLNSSGEPLQMHWHGQVEAPAVQDRARPDGGALAVGQTDDHDFALTPGTHWMHSHSLSEQQLLAAPMVSLKRIQPIFKTLLSCCMISPSGRRRRFWPNLAQALLMQAMVAA